jgi:hypothetical protein
MPASSTTGRAGTLARRAGYVVAVLVNCALLLVVNHWPGWADVPFLTSDTQLVVSAVNTAIAVHLAVNVVYVVRDPLWLKAWGDFVMLAAGVLVLGRIWEIFPFEVDTRSVDWALVVRLVLAVGIVGSCLGMALALGTFVRIALAAGQGGPSAGDL